MLPGARARDDGSALLPRAARVSQLPARLRWQRVRSLMRCTRWTTPMTCRQLQTVALGRPECAAGRCRSGAQRRLPYGATRGNALRRGMPRCDAEQRCATRCHAAWRGATRRDAVQRAATRYAPLRRVRWAVLGAYRRSGLPCTYRHVRGRSQHIRRMSDAALSRNSKEMDFGALFHDSSLPVRAATRG